MQRHGNDDINITETPCARHSFADDFTSKDAMDIRGFGEANIRKFVDLGLLQDIPGIYALPYDKIRELEGFGDKSIQKLQQAIEASKEQPLHRLLFALGMMVRGHFALKLRSINREGRRTGWILAWPLLGNQAVTTGDILVFIAFRR